MSLQIILLLLLASYSTSNGLNFPLNRNNRQMMLFWPGTVVRVGKQMPPHHEPDAFVFNTNPNNYPGGSAPPGPGGPGGFGPGGPGGFGPGGSGGFGPGGPGGFGPGGPGGFGPGGPGGFSPGGFGPGVPGGFGPGGFGPGGPGFFGPPRPGGPGGFGPPGPGGFGPPRPGGPNVFGHPGANKPGVFGPQPGAGGFLPGNAGGFVPNGNFPPQSNPPNGMLPRPELEGGGEGQETYDDPSAHFFPLTLL